MFRTSCNYTDAGVGQGGAGGSGSSGGGGGNIGGGCFMRPCTKQECFWAGCGSTAPFVCAAGGPVGGCTSDEQGWPNSGICSSCCDLSTCESRSPPSPTRAPSPEPSATFRPTNAPTSTQRPTVSRPPTLLPSTSVPPTSPPPSLVPTAFLDLCVGDDAMRDCSPSECSWAGELSPQKQHRQPEIQR